MGGGHNNIEFQTGAVGRFPLRTNHQKLEASITICDIPSKIFHQKMRMGQYIESSQFGVAKNCLKVPNMNKNHFQTLFQCLLIFYE